MSSSTIDIIINHLNNQDLKCRHDPIGYIYYHLNETDKIEIWHPTLLTARTEVHDGNHIIGNRVHSWVEQIIAGTVDHFTYQFSPGIPLAPSDITAVHTIKPKIYLAGPIGAAPFRMAHNVTTAIEFADALDALGLNVFIPHLSVQWHQLSPKSYEHWMNVDFGWIDACDALLRMPGDSPGADREVEYATAQGIPVFTVYPQSSSMSRNFSVSAMVQDAKASSWTERITLVEWMNEVRADPHVIRHRKAGTVHFVEEETLKAGDVRERRGMPNMHAVRVEDIAVRLVRYPDTKNMIKCRFGYAKPPVMELPISSIDRVKTEAVALLRARKATDVVINKKMAMDKLRPTPSLASTETDK